MYFILKMGNYQCADHCQTCLCQNLSTWDGENCTLLHPHEEPNIVMFVGLVLLIVSLSTLFLINLDFLHRTLYNEFVARMMVFLGFIGLVLLTITFLVLIFLDYDCTRESGLTTEWASNANFYLIIIFIGYSILYFIFESIDYYNNRDEDA